MPRLVYHGTRIPTNTIMTEGLVPRGCINYRKMLLQAARDLKIDMKKALKDEIARGVWVKTRDPACFNNIWVTDSKPLACEYAKVSPEDLQAFLRHAGISHRRITKYVAAKFGKPKCVSLKAPRGAEPSKYGVIIQVPIGKVSPESIIKIENCRG